MHAEVKWLRLTAKPRSWLRGVIFAMLVAGSSSVSMAQGWPSWADELFGNRYGAPRHNYRADVDERDRQTPKSKTVDVREGGPRPLIQAVPPPVVPFPHSATPDSIVINVAERKLYYVLTDNRAYAYPIGVGREGFGWTGTETITRKQEWPDWHPPAEMRERDSSLPEKMTGGLKNPLGAMAMYLGTTLYRIHGTNDAKSIGNAESSGCFRMLNSTVMHLASITKIGTPVTVVDAFPAQQVSQAPQLELANPNARSRDIAAESGTARRPPNDDTPDYLTLRDLTLKER